VYAYVCGDILHEGHLLQLENAKAMGDKLIVGILTDEAVMEKKVKPIISFAQRLRLVQAVGVVDMVVPQHDYSPVVNVKSLGVDILMESASHIGNDYLAVTMFVTSIIGLFLKLMDLISDPVFYICIVLFVVGIIFLLKETE